MKRVQTIRGRFYDANGQRLPSVTTILSCISKPALIAWSANVEREFVIAEAAELYDTLRKEDSISKVAFVTRLADRLGKQKQNQKLLEKAGDIGTQAHAMIEWMLRAELCQKVDSAPEIGQEAQYAVAAWQEWRSGVQFKPLFVESAVVSYKYGYAGTMDYLCAEVNGVDTLCDWKTGKRVYYEAHLQNAAYRVACREMGISDPKAGLILRLPKTKGEPEFEAVPARDEQECFQVFMAVKQLWLDMQKEDKWAKEQEEKAATVPRAEIPSE